VAGAAVGVVEAADALGPEKVQNGDIVIAMASSGLHSNGFSLVRHILASANIGYEHTVDELGVVGEALLVPTRLYTTPLVKVLEELPGAIHSLSHVTGGGIAANLARVIPVGSWVELDRSTWTPPAVFQTLAEIGGMTLGDTEGTWNLGVGMIAVVRHDTATGVMAALRAHGIESWVAGRVTVGERDLAGFEQGAKGVDGGAVQLVGAFKG
jgi:phosphoribosylformylglycinamidine cyclo-ligase